MKIERSRAKSYLDNLVIAKKRGLIDGEEFGRLKILIKKGLSGENVDLPAFIVGQ